jgi:thioredoxin reductase
MMRNVDVVIVGSSAAGLSAAQALGRSLRRVLVVDVGLPRNRFAAQMHNVLGHDGTPPAELVRRGRAEAERYGVEFFEGAVRTVNETESGLVVDLGTEQVRTRALIVASGVTDELRGTPGLAEHWGSSVLHCPYCHGWEVRGKRLAVLPHPAHGLHLVKLVRQLSEHVVAFVAELGELSAEDERALQARGVRVVRDPVAEVRGDADGVTGVRTADGSVIPIDAVFLTAPTAPQDAFVRGLGLDRSEGSMGSFIAVNTTGATSHPRVWAAGNVVNPGASVPVAAAAGSAAGAAVNMALADEDFRIASL